MAQQHHPKARLCHVIKNDNFDGYGFNLHAEKGKPGQYIGKVDEGSPAETAGLRQGDRILEVNGVSIANENHKEVVKRIKAMSGETKLLVIDPEDESSSTIDGNSNSNGSAVTTASAEDKPAESANNGQAHKEDEHAAGSNGNANNGNANNGNANNGNANNGNTNNGNVNNASSNGNGYNTSSNGNGTGLNLSMTAAELRAKLAAKKKFDPRKESIDFKKKFDTVQKL